jgi:hypothetical protein
MHYDSPRGKPDDIMWPPLAAKTIAFITILRHRVLHVHVCTYMYTLACSVGHGKPKRFALGSRVQSENTEAFGDGFCTRQRLRPRGESYMSRQLESVARALCTITLLPVRSRHSNRDHRLLERHLCYIYHVLA